MKLANSARVGELAGLTSDKTLKNNSFTGKINVKARVSSHAGSGFTAAGISANAVSQSLSGCSNSGEITLNVSRGLKTKPYGALSTDPSVKTNPKAKKVSSITRANCLKLSSTYWTYASKHKRLILKNNKEA